MFKMPTQKIGVYIILALYDWTFHQLFPDLFAFCFPIEICTLLTAMRRSGPRTRPMLAALPEVGEFFLFF